MSIRERNFDKKLPPLTSRLPLLWLSLSFIVGILFAKQVQAPNRLWFILTGIGLLLAVLASLLIPRLKLQPFHLSPWSLLLFVSALVFFFLGAARYRLTIPSVDSFHIAWYTERDYELVITGTLIEAPDNRDAYSNLRLDVIRVNTGATDLPVHGLILARVPSGGDWHYGDVIRVRGHLKSPTADEIFSYPDYLSRQDILAIMPDASATHLQFTAGDPVLRLVYAFRDSILTKLYQIFPDPEASLLAGILLGDDNGMPVDLQQAYENTGTGQIIAISGFNIVIIAGLFVTIFSRLLGRRRGAITAVIGIALYTVLAGPTPVVLRAAIMGTLSILALQVGRRQNGLNTLAFTAGVMAMINPLTLWEASFQLSFTATLGLILYAQPFQDWFTRLLAHRFSPGSTVRIAGLVGEYVLFTLAAELTSLPVMAYHFGRISLVAVLATPFVLPAQPVVEILSGLAVLLGFIYLPLGKLSGWLAWPFATYINKVVEFFNGFPHGVIVLGKFSLLFVILFYAVLLSLTFIGQRVKNALRPFPVPVVILATLVIASYLVWPAAFAAPDGNLHLTFLDVGSANAVLIQTPGGRSVLVDGGTSPSRLSYALGQRLPLIDRHLDWLVVASTAEQELAALPHTMLSFPAADVLWSGPIAASHAAEQLDDWLSANSILPTHVVEGAGLDLGQGARLEVSNVTSLGAVLLVEWRGFRALLPIGMNLDMLSATQNGKSIGPVTALLLADSGSDLLNPPEWLANLRPRVAVLSVQAGDPNNLPVQTVLDSLQNITLLRTDRNGWITLSTDGTQLWVDVEKK